MYHTKKQQQYKIVLVLLPLGFVMGNAIWLYILMYLNTYIHMTDTCLSRRHRSRKSTYALVGTTFSGAATIPTFAYYSETKKYQDQHRLIRVISIMKANRKRETLAYNTILPVGST